MRPDQRRQRRDRRACAEVWDVWQHAGRGDPAVSRRCDRSDGVLPGHVTDAPMALRRAPHCAQRRLLLTLIFMARDPSLLDSTQPSTIAPATPAIAHV
jgi:hypothetical protein